MSSERSDPMMCAISIQTVEAFLKCEQLNNVASFWATLYTCFDFE